MALYKSTAGLLEKAIKHEASVKHLAMSSTVGDKRQVMALMCRVLECIISDIGLLLTSIYRLDRPVLEELLAATKLLELEKKVLGCNKSLAMLLVYEHLFSRRGIVGGGQLKQAVLRHKTRLHAELVKLKVKKGVKNNEELVDKSVRDLNQQASLIPRYVRVNLNVMSVDKAISSFQENKFRLLDFDHSQKLQELKPKARVFWRDTHLPDLLAFPPGTNLTQHPLYTSGAIILQDKASCFPASALNPPPGSICLDACAAPGNKTSHLSSLMKNSGHVYAFDLDLKRLNTLKRLTSKAKCTNITAQCGSFLDVDPTKEPYCHVEYLLLDPSCSGSGIVNRMDHLVDGVPESTETKANEERLLSLAEFQQSVIMHAMRFPKAKRVVYSTCSIHKQENEDVCSKILEAHPDWKLIPCLPSWSRRGIDLTDSVRALPEDGTNGFFVALFERKTHNKV